MTDKHYTTPELARAIVDHLLVTGELADGMRVLDPCVGLGAFANAVKSACPNCTVVTIDDDPLVEADIHGDFLAVPVRESFDLVVSNPPFSLAQRFIEKSIGHCNPTGSVVFLMLLQFLGSSKRKDLFDAYPVSSVDVIRPRPSFAADGGTDAREYAVFRWVLEDFNPRCRGTIGFLDVPRPKRPRLATGTKKRGVDKPIQFTTTEAAE